MIYRVTYYENKVICVEPELDMSKHMDSISMNLKKEPMIYIGLGFLNKEDYPINTNLFYYLCNLDIVDDKLIEIRSFIRP